VFYTWTIGPRIEPTLPSGTANVSTLTVLASLLVKPTERMTLQVPRALVASVLAAVVDFRSAGVVG
jgi:hypothetical protein